jgi:Ca2+-binding RTX toxin-like protein
MRHRFIALAASATLVLGLVAAGSGVAVANDDPGHDHCGPPWEDPTYVLGTTGDDRLVGDDCDNILIGFAGNDRLIGRFGEDTLRGGRHNDVLRGVDGEADQLNGGSGFDRCYGDLLLDNFRRCEVVVEVLFGA